MTLGCARIGVTENGRCNADMFGIVQSNKCDGAVSKQMRIDGHAEGTLRDGAYS